MRTPIPELSWYGGSWSPPPGPVKPPDVAHTAGVHATSAPTDPALLARVGVVLGRFLPPHLGHLHLVEQAFSQCGALHVFYALDPNAHWRFKLHHEAVTAAFAGYAHVHFVDDAPLDERAPDFFSTWAARVRATAPNVTHVFSSDPHGGDAIARALGVAHVLVDPERRKFPIQARDIRTDLFAKFGWLVPSVRPLFAQQVGLVGVEGAGKTSLARELAAATGSPLVDEALRSEAERAGAVPEAGAFERVIHEAERRRVAAAEASTSGLVVVDDSARLAWLWSERVGRPVSLYAQNVARAESFALWLFCHDDFDVERERDDPAGRAQLAAALVRDLAPVAHKVVHVRGSDGRARVDAALAAVLALRDAENERLRRWFA